MTRELFGLLTGKAYMDSFTHGTRESGSFSSKKERQGLAAEMQISAAILILGR